MSNPYGADVTGAIYDGPTACVVKFVPISNDVSGTVVAAVSGKKIRVLSYVLVVAGAVGVNFQSAGPGVVLTGVMTFDAGGKGVSAPYCPVGHFETPVGATLQIILSAGVLTSGHLTYIEVSA